MSTREERYVKSDYNDCVFRGICKDEFNPELCNPLCQIFSELDYQLQMSCLPRSCWGRQELTDKFLNKDVSNKMQEILKHIGLYVEEGHNLFLYGEPGCGKSSWAIKFLNNYFAYVAMNSGGRIPRGLFVNVPSFLRDAKLNITYKDDEYKEKLDQIQACDVVVWDDIGQTTPTMYESQWLYSYINERLQAKLCNVFTSNLSPEQLAVEDKRLASRICVGADTLLISGPDMRSKNTFKFTGV